MKYRSILCEDNEGIREILNYVLQKRGHEVFSFEDAGDCPLYSLTECKCNNNLSPCSDIIISDVAMPKVSGLEFVENLKKKGCKIEHIALVSGYWTEKSISKAKNIGCTVFHKPDFFEELIVWVTTCEKAIDPQRVLSDCYL